MILARHFVSVNSGWSSIASSWVRASQNARMCIFRIKVLNIQFICEISMSEQTYFSNMANPRILNVFICQSRCQTQTPQRVTFLREPKTI
uniref:Uncharacterized protein n=1 Tax=Kalanchoe fedtschenkoi TaxID=63787 RepID=A0A7N0U898_KALFE